MSLVRDEQNGVSTARVGFWVWTVFTIALIAAVVTGRATDPGQAVWTLVGGVYMGLITWAAGPRMAQYLAPAIGSVARSIGAARVVERRKQGGDFEVTP